MRNITIAALGAVALASGASASTLVWENHPGHDWTPGDTGPNVYSVDGVNITVDVADPGGVLLASSPGPLPDDDNPWVSGFWIAGEFTSGEFITTTISFDVAVTDVSFDMFDIDGTNRDESVIVQGWSNGSLVAMASSATGSGVEFDGIDTFSNNRTSDMNPGAAADVGSVLGFASAIDAITLAYTADAGGAYGYIIGDINFTEIPAPSAAALFGLAGLSAARRRR